MPSKHKMKKGGGARKGSAYERDLCKRFSLWWSCGQTEDLFWRTSGSGSRATNRRRLGKNPNWFDFGDMKHETPEGLLLVKYLCWEFRSRAKFDLMTAFGTGSEDQNYSLMASWAKANYEADCSDRCPVLVTKSLRKPDIVWMEHKLYLEIESIERSYDESGGRGVFDSFARISVFIPPRTVKYDKNKTYRFESGSLFVGVPLVDCLFAMDPEGFIECVQTYVSNR